MVGRASTERGRERHPPGPVVALTGFLPMQRYPDYSECLCKASALSPSLLTTSSPMQAFSAQVLTKPWLRPMMAIPFHLPSFHHIPPQLLQPTASKYTLPRNPLCFPGYWVATLGTGWDWHLGDCLLFPGSLQTDPEQGWSDTPRCASRRLLCLP